MSMLLITKELAEAVVASHTWESYGEDNCQHCRKSAFGVTLIQHTPECIVTRAKLLLEQEWGIPNKDVEVLQSKGDGEWHVCQLDGRFWRGVDDQWFRKKKDAIRWAENNGYIVKNK